MGTDNLARWTIYSYEFARERLVRLDCLMNAFGLPIGIVVLRADNDTGVAGVLFVKTNEIAAIDSQKGAIIFSGEGQHFRVVNGLIVSPRLVCGQNIMPKSAKSVHNLQGKVFICIQRGHTLRLLVFFDGLVYFVVVSIGVQPCVNQIGGAQRWIVLQNSRLVPSQTPIIF